MSFFWFMLAVGFFIAWLSSRSSSGKTRLPPADGDEIYRRGLKDGYDAFGNKVRALLDSGDPSRDDLQDLVDDGRVDDIAVAPVYDPVQDQAPVVSAATETRVQTEEELAEEKERSTLRNLNMLLYIGSFLIVAAAALFVTLVMPAAVKLTSLILVTITFYVSGLVLHAHSLRLRPAAIAFAGTGLAILPFVGFALTSLGGLSAEVAWLITSAVGLLAYGVAALRLQSELVSYLTMAFAVSLALSAVSTLGLSMIWYFIVIIGISLALNSVHILFPMLLPKVFSKSVQQTGQGIVPLALVASLFTVEHMNLFMYEVLYAAATAHYLVVWLEKRTRVYETFVRILGHATLLIIAFDSSGMDSGVNGATYESFGLWWLAIAALQIAYSLVRVRTTQKSLSVERRWVAVMIGVIFCGMTLWLGSANNIAQLSALSFLLMGIAACAATLRFRQAGWAYVGLISSLVLPFIVGRGVIAPDVPYEVLSGVFAVFALISLVVLDRVQSAGRSYAVRHMISISVVAYAVAVAMSGILTLDGAAIGWTALASAALFVLLSYLLKAVAIEIVGALFAVVSVVALVSDSPIESQWRIIVGVVVAVAILGAGACVHHFNRERSRRDGLMGLAAIVFVGISFVLVSGAESVVIQTATVLLLVASVAAIGLRLVLKSATSLPVQISQCVYLSYPLLALLVAWQAGAGWVSLALLTYTVLLWLASYVEKVPAALVIGNVLLVLAVTSFWNWLEFDPSWRIYGVTWISAVIFYATYWLMVDKRDAWRQQASLISVWVVLGIAVLAGIWSSDVTWLMASAGSLLMIAGTLAMRGYQSDRPQYIEVAAYLATFGLQRMTELLIPETNMVVYGHWWALVIALVALWHKDNQKNRLIIALVFVTGSTGLYALAGTPGYSLVFLVEHVIILTIGAILHKQWMMWWGVASVVVAVMYFLRDFTFLALLFLGFLLILFVVWRLTKMGKKQAPNE